MGNGNKGSLGASCSAICWLVAVLFGLLVVAILITWANWPWMIVLVIGLIAVVAAGWVLPTYFCQELDGSDTDGQSSAEAAALSGAAIADIPPAETLAETEMEIAANDTAPDAGAHGIISEVADASVKAEEPETAASSEDAVSPQGKGGGRGAGKGKGGGKGKGQGRGNGPGKGKGPGQGKGNGKGGGKGKSSPVDAPAEVAAPVAAEPVAPTPAAAPKADGKPALFASAPDSPDDLKMIKGVGPALEKTLNDLGIYTFAQIVVWTPDDVAWVDGHLRFKGRIERDDWMSQAKILGKGGETAFSKKVEDGDVY